MKHSVRAHTGNNGSIMRAVRHEQGKLPSLTETDRAEREALAKRPFSRSVC